jgi:hypothetical protein
MSACWSSYPHGAASCALLGSFARAWTVRSLGANLVQFGCCLRPVLDQLLYSFPSEACGGAPAAPFSASAVAPEYVSALSVLVSARPHASSIQDFFLLAPPATCISQPCSISSPDHHSGTKGFFGAGLSHFYCTCGLLLGVLPIVPSWVPGCFPGCTMALPAPGGYFGPQLPWSPCGARGRPRTTLSFFVSLVLAADVRNRSALQAASGRQRERFD